MHLGTKHSCRLEMGEEVVSKLLELGFQHDVANACAYLSLNITEVNLMLDILSIELNYLCALTRGARSCMILRSPCFGVQC